MLRFIWVTALALLTTGIPSKAMAEINFSTNTAIYHVYGGFLAVDSAFQKIDLIFSNSGYHTLFIAAAMMAIVSGAFTMAGKHLMGGNGGTVLTFMLPIIFGAMVYVALFARVGKVIVRDDVLSLDSPVAYSHIPLGIVYMGGIMNSIESKIVDLVNMTASPGSDYLMTASGIGVNLLNHTAQEYVLDSSAADSLNSYINDCVMFELVRPGTTLSVDDLISTPLATPLIDVLVAAKNPALFSNSWINAAGALVKGGVNLSCSDMYDGLKIYYTKSSNLAKITANACGASGLDPANTNQCKNILLYAIQNTFKDSGSVLTVDSFVSNMLISKIIDSFIKGSGNTTKTVVATAGGMSVKGLSDGMGSRITNTMTRAGFTAIILAVTPFLAIFLPTAMGKRALGLIFSLLAWVVIWEICDLITCQFMMENYYRATTALASSGLGVQAMVDLPTVASTTAGTFGYMTAGSAAIATVITGTLIKFGGSEMTHMNANLQKSSETGNIMGSAGQAAAVANSMSNLSAQSAMATTYNRREEVAQGAALFPIARAIGGSAEMNTAGNINALATSKALMGSSNYSNARGAAESMLSSEREHSASLTGSVETGKLAARKVAGREAVGTAATGTEQMAIGSGTGAKETLATGSQQSGLPVTALATAAGIARSAPAVGAGVALAMAAGGSLSGAAATGVKLGSDQTQTTLGTNEGINKTLAAQKADGTLPPNASLRSMAENTSEVNSTTAQNAANATRDAASGTGVSLNQLSGMESHVDAGKKAAGASELTRLGNGGTLPETTQEMNRVAGSQGKAIGIPGAQATQGNIEGNQAIVARHGDSAITDNAAAKTISEGEGTQANTRALTDTARAMPEMSAASNWNADRTALSPAGLAQMSQHQKSMGVETPNQFGGKNTEYRDGDGKVASKFTQGTLAGGDKDAMAFTDKMIDKARAMPNGQGDNLANYLQEHRGQGMEFSANEDRNGNLTSATFRQQAAGTSVSANDNTRSTRHDNTVSAVDRNVSGKESSVLDSSLNQAFSGSVSDFNGVPTQFEGAQYKREGNNFTVSGVPKGGSSMVTMSGFVGENGKHTGVMTQDTAGMRFDATTMQSKLERDKHAITPAMLSSDQGMKVAAMGVAGSIGQFINQSANYQKTSSLSADVGAGLGVSAQTGDTTRSGSAGVAPQAGAPSTSTSNANGVDGKIGAKIGIGSGMSTTMSENINTYARDAYNVMKTAVANNPGNMTRASEEATAGIVAMEKAALARTSTHFHQAGERGNAVAPADYSRGSAGAGSASAAAERQPKSFYDRAAALIDQAGQYISDKTGGHK